jgi:hypothetical protein
MVDAVWTKWVARTVTPDGHNLPEGFPMMDAVRGFGLAVAVITLLVFKRGRDMLSRRSAWIAIAIAAALSWGATPTSAGPIIGNTAGGSAGPSGFGNYTGNIAVANVTATSGEVDVTLNNTTPSSTGGFLTGFVFNLPASVTSVTSASLVASNTNFQLLGGPTFTNHSINGSPFGQFDIGASLGGDFQGGGNPTLGLPAGSTGTFRFLLTGTGLNDLSQANIEASLSIPPGQGMGPAFFLARFRSFNVQPDSNHVPAMSSIPEPASLTLAGIGLGFVGLIQVRRRRIKPTSA